MPSTPASATGPPPHGPPVGRLAETALTNSEAGPCAVAALLDRPRELGGIGHVRLDRERAEAPHALPESAERATAATR